MGVLLVQRIAINVLMQVSVKNAMRRMVMRGTQLQESVESALKESSFQITYAMIVVRIVLHVQVQIVHSVMRDIFLQKQVIANLVFPLV